MAVAHEASSAVRLEPAVSETAERLFQEHSGWIYGYCLRLLRSPEEAEDALQATYLNACRGLKAGVRPEVGSAWLLRIAQNVCLTRLRSSGRRARLERVQDGELIEQTVAAPERRGDELIGLGDALASLPEQQRRAILLREWQGLSYAEVAARLGLTQAAVETLIFRARRSLASALEDPGKRRRLRLAHAFDVAGLVAAIKGFLAGGASAKVAVALVVAATTATVAATDPANIWHDRGVPPTEAEAALEAAAVDPAPQSPASVPFVGPGDRPDLVRVAVAVWAAGAQGVDAAASGRSSGERAGSGQGNADEAGTNGQGKGKTVAPGQAKKAGKAEKAEKTENGKAQPGKPAFADTTGPPPHASGQKDDPDKLPAQASPTAAEAVELAPETSQSKSGKSGQKGKSGK